MILKLILSFVVSVVGSTALAALPALKFKTAECSFLKDEKVVKQQTVALMVLQIDNGFGRFAQLQFGDEKLPIQYQVLIEDDLAHQATDHVIVLQNFKVGELESSAEFSSREVNWLRIAQGTYSVRCELK